MNNRELRTGPKILKKAAAVFAKHQAYSSRDRCGGLLPHQELCSSTRACRRAGTTRGVGLKSAHAQRGRQLKVLVWTFAASKTSVGRPSKDSRSLFEHHERRITNVSPGQLRRMSV